MQADIYFIPVHASGSLAQLPCPQARAGLSDTLQAIRAAGVDRLVSMLESSEERNLGLQDESALFEEFGGEFTRFPIPDLCLPGDTQSFIALSEALAADVKSGRGVAIHCRAGIGRSGMLNCAVLTQLGMSVDDALQHISRYRGVRVPDTDEQAHWLRQNLTPKILSDI